MADTQAKKILGHVWASGVSAARFDPGDVGIVRVAGWSVAYEQIGSGFEPEREIFNQRFRELDGWAEHNMRSGGSHEWDSDINYYQYARAYVGLHKYVALVATGPRVGNQVHPEEPGNAVWRLY